MKKMSKKEMTKIVGGKGRENAKNVFPELPVDADLSNVPALPAEQKGNGKRPF